MGDIAIDDVTTTPGACSQTGTHVLCILHQEYLLKLCLINDRKICNYCLADNVLFDILQATVTLRKDFVHGLT